MTEAAHTKYLVIINDSPYGNECPYSGLRLAYNIAKRAVTEVRVYLIGDGVNCASAGRRHPRVSTTSNAW